MASHPHLCNLCGWWSHEEVDCPLEERTLCPAHVESEQGLLPQTNGASLVPVEEAAKVIFISDWMERQVARLEKENKELRRTN